MLELPGIRSCLSVESGLAYLREVVADTEDQTKMVTAASELGPEYAEDDTIVKEIKFSRPSLADLLSTPITRQL